MVVAPRLSLFSSPRTRRQEILDAATSLFARRGYHQVTVDEVGALLDISGPALYHHFASKEALLDESLLAISDRLLAGARERIESAATPVQSLGSLLDWQVRFAVERPDLIVVHQRDLINASAEAQRRIRRLQGRYVELWVDVLLELDPESSRAHARSVTHAMLGLVNSTPHSSRRSSEITSDVLRRMAVAAIESMGFTPGRKGRNHAG